MNRRFYFFVCFFILGSSFTSKFKDQFGFLPEPQFIEDREKTLWLEEEKVLLKNPLKLKSLK